MSTSDRFVIIGGGLAGGKAAEALREQGFDGSIALLTNERYQPYERPALSKGYLTGSATRGSVFVHEPDWYLMNRVDVRVETPATAIDRVGHRVTLADGTDVGYDKLLLATGSHARPLPVQGSDVPGVHFLRTLDDSDGIAEMFTTAKRLVVIGAGWIGLEVTAAARAAGLHVTVVEAADLPLLRVLGPAVARIFADLHHAHGVDLRFGISLGDITVRDGQVDGVRLLDGTVIPADAVLVGVGAAPNVGLADDCGLTVNNGIVTDEALRTSDPDIFAAGDVANAFHPLLGRHIRVEHWANALKQPAVAAASMLGLEASYTDLPYFYTDQYELGMEYVGYVDPGGYDQVVFRGDVAGLEFIAFWLMDGRVLAGMNVNVWDVTDPIKALIRSGEKVDVERLADPNVPLDRV
jgi:3-phenylpropionate/trans-cinnamate dioxygenase ferredoxin reductase subunit